MYFLFLSFPATSHGSVSPISSDQSLTSKREKNSAKSFPIAGSTCPSLYSPSFTNRNAELPVGLSSQTICCSFCKGCCPHLSATHGFYYPKLKQKCGNFSVTHGNYHVLGNNFVKFSQLHSVVITVIMSGKISSSSFLLRGRLWRPLFLKSVFLVSPPVGARDQPAQTGRAWERHTSVALPHYLWSFREG